MMRDISRCCRCEHCSGRGGRGNLDRPASPKSVKFVQMVDSRTRPGLRVNQEAHFLRLKIVVPKILLRASLENRNLCFRRQHADEFERGTVASGLVLRPDLGLGREGAVGPCLFIDVSLHVEERSFSCNDGVELHDFYGLILTPTTS